MNYRLELTRAARRDLRSLSAQMKRRIDAKILSLSEDPRPSGVEKLSGKESLYRIRVGDYRLIYEIRDDVLVVLVIKIGHRRDVYRSLR